MSSEYELEPPRSYDSRRNDSRRGRSRGRGSFRGGRGSWRGNDRFSRPRGRGFRGSFQPPPEENINYDNRVFVGNLSFDTTAEDLVDYFSQVGEVVTADIITFKGRHKGLGTVEFTNADDATEAIERCDNTHFMGRDIYVKDDQPPPGARQKTMRIAPIRDINRQGYEAFVINLPYSITWQNLKDLFRECGDILRADIELDYNGFSRGLGSVLYATEDAMHRAIDTFNGYELEGRVLEVREGKFNPSHKEHIPEGTLDEVEPSIPTQSPFVEGVVGNGERNPTVFCQSLPLSTTVPDLYDLFGSFGDINHAELIYDTNGLSTGSAVVEYMSADYAEMCIDKLNNYNYGGHQLDISFAHRL
ncbi:single-stranded telomeric DNA-binding/mRNA-binding protein NDAI_0G04190 [Naumovozyma dairenensis CBS 421]|uniref:RRM domain-containing protein n=1 Tax=Naumovozyma dairenensis (strain ATCC 10597 / BCRC 20456 / CBS 421 / NBRC 0211 / NRRL Y-12639) TaxID=1071378 RepID=J7RE83_NAUDC|nr:hypothetical protein NDAI_0G04190 [Naumovozyma dairenensis CBS 421]CCK73404.1 hypothetical protein NDAI_0G04190 [Naumovozyma dairenensis CBS 421]